ncbi:hypothetical protein [Clostridium saudiense]|uniref:hypothetical protein n=1 Tax=Clostridium saudiense TaxID=1414720 RepID=UPI002670EE62|nr:hypothetical protein [Clostridium saudiense]
MLLIDYALLLGTGLAMYEGLNYLDNFKNNKKWNDLQKGIKIENYKILESRKTDYGSLLTIELPPGGTTTKLEDNIEAIEKAYKCRCILKNIPFSDLVEIELVTKEIKGLKQPLMLLTPYQLLFGYDFKGDPIIADMSSTTHLGVVGTSKMGKSVCIEMALQAIQEQINILMINCFSDDFKSLQGRRINDNQAMKEALEEELNNKEWREKPLYILIDEYNVLSKTVKKIDDVIQGLLAQGRHFNVYLIVIMQLGNKEDCKFKNLFNCRLAFKTIEKQTISAFLGCPVQDTNLQRQEFYLYHTELIRGRSYDKIKNPII